MADLAARIEARLRAEWPGEHYTDLRGRITVPPIREGGATDALVKFAAFVIREEIAEHDREVRRDALIEARDAATRPYPGVGWESSVAKIEALIEGREPDDVRHSANTPDGERSLWDLPIAGDDAAPGGAS